MLKGQDANVSSWAEIGWRFRFGLYMIAVLPYDTLLFGHFYLTKVTKA